MDLWYGLRPNQSPVSVPFIIHTRLLACIKPKQLKRAARIAAGRRGRIKIGGGERSERSMSEEQFLDVAVEAAKNAGEVPLLTAVDSLLCVSLSLGHLFTGS